MSDTWPKKTNPKAKKSPTSFSQSGLSFSNFGTLSLTTPETHIKSDPTFRNHRLYNTENQEKKKSPVTHQPHPQRPTRISKPQVIFVTDSCAAATHYRRQVLDSSDA